MSHENLKRRHVHEWPDAPLDAPEKTHDNDVWCPCHRICDGGKWVSTSTRYRHNRGGPRSNDHEMGDATNQAPNAAVPGPSDRPLSPDNNDIPDDSDDHDNMLFHALQDQAAGILDALNANAQAENGSTNNMDHEHNRTPSPPLSRHEATPPPDPLPQNAQPDPIPTLEHLLTSNAFIDLLRNASLEDEFSGLSEDDIFLIRNPSTQKPCLDDPNFRLSLDVFLAINGKAPQETYKNVRNAIHKHSTMQLLSYSQIVRQIKLITGVIPVLHDMCVNSCLAYTGPFRTLLNCTYCGEPRYKSQRGSDEPDRSAPRRQFLTVPIAMQGQALWRDENMAEDMSYGFAQLTEVLAEVRENGTGLPSVFRDIYSGQDLLEAVEKGLIKEHDLLLLFSLDGCRLYQNKQSDTWIAIWIILNLHPNLRYLKKFIRPAFTVPGPNHPKHTDSFLFPSLHHLAALQNEKNGVPVWDGRDALVHRSDPYLVYGTADTVGLADMSGWVGHNGKFGCRFMCGLPGRHKFHAPTYYPALLKPLACDGIQGTDHADFDINSLPAPSTDRYLMDLRKTIASRNQTQYRANRLATGITKPTIFSGLPRATAMPRLFPADQMHRDGLNIPQHLVALWRGTIDHAKDDSPSEWPWAVFLDDDAWQEHGKEVEKWGKKLPDYIADRPPRNPAERMNSGYKASEYLTWIFVLGPGLLYKHLPPEYWSNFCQIAAGLHTIHSYTIPFDDLKKAHINLLQAVLDFEHLYYQRRLDRLNFIPQCIHALLHLALEVLRVGSPAAVAQWALERTIGDLEAEIRQHANPFANLAIRVLLRCQVNTLKSLIPDLDPLTAHAPRGSVDLGSGFLLLRAREGCKITVQDSHATALISYIARRGVDTSSTTPADVAVERWAGLRLPNGHRVRTHWKESLRPPASDNAIRRYVGITYNDEVRYAEVQFFCLLDLEDDKEEAVAVVKMFSRWDQEIFTKSYEYVRVVKIAGSDTSVIAIPVTDITQVVGIVKFDRNHDEVYCNPDEYFMARKFGTLDIDTEDDDLDYDLD